MPSDVVPSLNVTEPVGAPAPGEATATLAVKGTFWPAPGGVAEGGTVVVGGAGVTNCVWVPEPPPLELLSPAEGGGWRRGRGRRGHPRRLGSSSRRRGSCPRRSAYRRRVLPRSPWR